VTRPVETQSSSGPFEPRIGALVADVRGFLEVWRDIFGATAAWVPAQVEVLRRQAQSFQARAREVGADALAQHLSACSQCLEETPIDRGKLGRCLRNVSELAWQLRQRSSVPSEVAETPSSGGAGLDRVAKAPRASIPSATESTPAPWTATAQAAKKSTPPPPTATAPVISAAPSAPRPSAAPRVPTTPPTSARPTAPRPSARTRPPGTPSAPPTGPASPAPPVAAPLTASPIVAVRAATGPVDVPRPSAVAPEASRSAESDADVAEEPPSLQVLLELGSASVAGQSPLPPAEPTPGIAEIEGFPISERPGAIQDLFAAAEPSGRASTAAARSTSSSPAPNMAQGPPALRSGRPTLPFGAPVFEALSAPPPPAPAPLASPPPLLASPPPLLASPPPLMAELGSSPRAAPPAFTAPPNVSPSRISAPAAPVSPPAYGVPPEVGTTTPYGGPGWASPQASGIRWGLVLLIIAALGGIAAVVIGLEVMQRGAVAAGPKEPAAFDPKTALIPVVPGQELDEAAFGVLRAHVHAFGGAESPALRALLDTEAGALRHAATPTCAAGCVGCLLSPNGVERSHYRPLGAPARGEQSASVQALTNLRLPVIGVAADPRVRALFEFHTEHAVGREIFQGTLFQCGAYQALIREVLIRQDVPLDLSALAMVASGCVGDVESPTAARGLWQVTPLAAQAYDLQIIPGVIDERLDPMKSTAAAIRMLADLRQKTGSWELATASFGVGPFELLSRLARAGAQADFWRLADSDPLLKETAGFVAKVQAYALILSNLDRYHFQDPPAHSLEVTDTVEVPAGTRLGLVARAAGTSTTRIRELNPDLLGQSVPAEPAATFVVRVPQTGAQRARDNLPALISDADGAEQCVPHHFDWGRQRFTRNMAYRCQQASR
jgi:membrane-bound lytic murein transglycosylase D